MKNQILALLLLGGFIMSSCSKSDDTKERLMGDRWLVEAMILSTDFGDPSVDIEEDILHELFLPAIPCQAQHKAYYFDFKNDDLIAQTIECDGELFLGGDAPYEIREDGTKLFIGSSDSDTQPQEMANTEYDIVRHTDTELHLRNVTESTQFPIHRIILEYRLRR